MQASSVCLSVGRSDSLYKSWVPELYGLCFSESLHYIWTYVLEFSPGKATVLQNEVSLEILFFIFWTSHWRNPVFSVEQKRLYLRHDSANAYR